jgi:hypothetical protein
MIIQVTSRVVMLARNLVRSSQQDNPLSQHDMVMVTKPWHTDIHRLSATCSFSSRLTPFAGTHNDADWHACKVKVPPDGIHQLPPGALGQGHSACEKRKCRWSRFDLHPHVPQGPHTPGLLNAYSPRNPTTRLPKQGSHTCVM